MGLHVCNSTTFVIICFVSPPPCLLKQSIFVKNNIIIINKSRRKYIGTYLTIKTVPGDNVGYLKTHVTTLTIEKKSWMDFLMIMMIKK